MEYVNSPAAVEPVRFERNVHIRSAPAKPVLWIDCRTDVFERARLVLAVLVDAINLVLRENRLG